MPLTKLTDTAKCARIKKIDDRYNEIFKELCELSKKIDQHVHELESAAIHLVKGKDSKSEIVRDANFERCEKKRRPSELKIQKLTDELVNLKIKMMKYIKELDSIKEDDGILIIIIERDINKLVTEKENKEKDVTIKREKRKNEMDKIEDNIKKIKREKEKINDRIKSVVRVNQEINKLVNMVDGILSKLKKMPVISGKLESISVDVARMLAKYEDDDHIYECTENVS